MRSMVGNVASAYRKFRGSRWRWLVPAGLVAIAFHVSPVGVALDRAFFDTLSRHPLVDPPLVDRSAIVLVDDLTMDLLGREPRSMRWPLPRAAFAGLIAALDRAGAERIVLDLVFFDQSESAEQDLILATTAAATRSVVLARTERQGPVFWDAAFRARHAEYFTRPRTGDVTYRPDEDGAVRRYEVPGSLAAAAFDEPPVSEGGLIHWQGGLEKIRTRGVPVLSAGPLIEEGLRIVGEFEPTDSPEIIARKIAAWPALPDAITRKIRGRTVFVGANAAGTFDLKPLPVGALEPGILTHWTAWTNLAEGGFITPVPRLLALLAALGAGVLVVAIDRRTPGLSAAVLLTGGLIALAVTGAYTAFAAGWFFPSGTPIFTVALTLLVVAAENFWTEQRRKRELQVMFGAYVDPSVVARLVRDPEALKLGGERREATVFFCDLAGFTDLSEKLPPEQLLAVVNAYLEETSECLLDHGAYIDKYIGDAVMAVFGAPQPLDDPALAACKGALATLRIVKDINTRFADILGAVGAQLAVRVGINTGEMIVGNLGSTRKKNYTVLGDAVNLASRLEGANKEFGTSILLGDTTARSVAGKLATRPLTRLRVKGKKQAIEVHELVGEPESLAEPQRTFLAAYRAGYVCYAARDFAGAIDALTRAAAAGPKDEVTRALLASALRFSQSPPPPDWEPILQLDSK